MTGNETEKNFVKCILMVTKPRNVNIRQKHLKRFSYRIELADSDNGYKLTHFL